jgi:hypothetical protein
MSVQRKAPPGAKKLVWRITPDAPKGAWVDPASIRPPKEDAPQWGSETWAMSSFELEYGADISEVSDTVPEALLDQLFPPKDDSPKPAGKK